MIKLVLIPYFQENCCVNGTFFSRINYQQAYFTGRTNLQLPVFAMLIKKQIVPYFVRNRPYI